MVFNLLLFFFYLQNREY